MITAWSNNNAHSNDNNNACSDNVSMCSDNNNDTCSTITLDILIIILNNNMFNSNDDARSDDSINACSDYNF